jgi:hypothetical protein
MFGDEDEVAVYQYELEIEPTTHAIRDHHLENKANAQQIDVTGEQTSPQGVQGIERTDA